MYFAQHKYEIKIFIKGNHVLGNSMCGNKIEETA